MNDMFKCPHCGKPGILVWRKLTIGLYNPAICKKCGNEIRVSYISLIILTILFTVGFMSVLFFVDSIILTKNSYLDCYSFPQSFSLSEVCSSYS